MRRTPLAIVVRPSHGGRHSRASGAVQKQVRRPPGLVLVVRLVEIPDRCEKIPLGLLEVRLRYSKGPSQAQWLLRSPRKFCMPVPPRRRRFGGRRRPSDIDHGLPKPIRRRRPPFLLRVDARTSAVRSRALAGRERAPMTQATSSSLYRLQTWQRVAEAVHGLQGSCDYCNR